MPGHALGVRVPSGGMGPQNLGLPVQARPSGQTSPGSYGVPGGGKLLCLFFLPVPPNIREDGHRANVSGMAGQSLTLECDANGFPAPEIVWLKDGQLVGVLWGGPAAGGM